MWNVTLAEKQKEEEAEERKKQRKKEQEEERRQAVQALTDLFSSGALFFLEEEEEEEEEEKTSSHSFSLSVSGCCLRSTWTRPRILRIAWFYSGNMFMPRSWRPFWTNSTQLVREGGARAVRTWKPGLSTSHWYLPPTCSVPVTPEEHVKVWSFLGDDNAELFLRLFVSGSHWCGAHLVARLKSTGIWNFLGDDFGPVSALSAYVWFNSGYNSASVCGGFGLSHIFFVKMNSDPEDD